MERKKIKFPSAYCDAYIKMISVLIVAVCSKNVGNLMATSGINYKEEERTDLP